MRFIRKLNAFNERRRVKGTAEAYDRFWTAGFYRLCQEPRLTAVMVHSGRFFLKCFMLMCPKSVFEIALRTDHKNQSPPPRLRDENPHGQLCPCGVRLFQAGQHRNCHRQNGKSAASRSRCYTEADLSGMSRGHGKSGHALTWPLSRWVNTQLSDMGILSTKCFDLFFELLLPLLQQRTHLSLYCFQR